jgi:hypothetical protein
VKPPRAFDRAAEPARQSRRQRPAPSRSGGPHPLPGRQCRVPESRVTATGSAPPRIDAVAHEHAGRGTAVPGEFLSPLTRLRMNGSEWRIVVSVALSPSPMTAAGLARRLRLDYGQVKTLVRGLVAWRILERTPAGLRLRPEPACWGPPESGPPNPSHQGHPERRG